MTRKEYINIIATIAKKVCAGSDLFASTMIAQAIIESNSGASDLALEAHNHFGIKADSRWRGDRILFPTREVIKGKSVIIKDWFRKYDSLEEGFRDRNAFLHENPRYTKHGVFSASNPEGQAYAFEEAGYATDPNYAELISQVINGSIKLKDYDDRGTDDVFTTANLNLRKSPKIDNNIIVTLGKGTKLVLVKLVGDWALVYSYSKAKFGYVSAEYLS